MGAANAGIGRIAIVAATAALVLWGGPVGCERRYPQDSAQAVIESAREMVRRRRADRLTDLIRAETPQERRLLDRVGGLLGSLQDLGREVRRAFPGEVEALRDRARAAAEAGEADDALTRAFTGRSPWPRTRHDPGDALNEMLVDVLADPYAFLDEQSDRLTAVPIDAHTAALQWDGEPVFGPLVGLTLSEEADGRWRLVLPTHLPPVSRWLSDDDIVRMLEYVVVSLDNAVRDVRDDVRSGEVSSLEEVAHRAGEYAVVPLGIIMVAIARYSDDDGGRENSDADGDETDGTAR